MITNVGSVERQARGRRHHLWAWWSLILLPVSFGVALAVREGVAGLLAPSAPVRLMEAARR
jgi:hypothetical protein